MAKAEARSKTEKAEKKTHSDSVRPAESLPGASPFKR